MALAFPSTRSARIAHAGLSLRILSPHDAKALAAGSALGELGLPSGVVAALERLIGDPEQAPESRQIVRSEILLAGGAREEVLSLPSTSTERLSEDDQRLLQGEAYLQEAMRRRSISPEQATQARAERDPSDGMWPASWLSKRGHLDPTDGMWIQVEVDEEPLRVCLRCLELLGRAGRCAACGQAYQAGGSARPTPAIRETPLPPRATPDFELVHRAAPARPRAAHAAPSEPLEAPPDFDTLAPERPDHGTAVSRTPQPYDTLAPERSEGQAGGGREDHFLPGAYFAGYQIQRRLGEGGMGVVFVAKDPGLNRDVALKVLRGGALAGGSSKRRFLFEAEAAAALKHPNIVAIHQIGEHLGYPFYAMDLVENARALDDWADGVTHGEVVEVMAQVADAVHFFHTRGILHRDLKPDNVLVDSVGLPRIIDFGIARAFDGNKEDTRGWTVAGDVLGTPWYMAPEQAAGDQSLIDVRCDVYALGAILYHLLGGAAPYASLSASEVLAEIAKNEPAPLGTLCRGRARALDSDLEALVGVAMAREPERRYSGADELRDDLRRHLACEPLVAQAPTFGYRLSKFVRRNRARVIAAGAGMLVASALGVWAGVRAWSLSEAVESLLAQADQTADEQERIHLLEDARSLAPEDRLVRISLDRARESLAAASRRREAQRLAQERERTTAAQRELERERERGRLEDARRAQTAAEGQLKARVEARERLHREALGLIEARLLEAEASPDPFRRYGLLSEALYRLPADEPALRLRVEEAFLDCTLQLAEGAIETRLAGLTQFWLHEARKVATSDERADEIAELEAAARELSTPPPGER